MIENMEPENNEKQWFGWIPILTTKLISKYFIKKLDTEKEKLSEGEKKFLQEQGENLDKTLSRNGKYYLRYLYSDVGNKKFKVIVSIDGQNKIDNIFMYSSDNEIKVHAICNVEDTGLVNIGLAYPVGFPGEYQLIKQAYIITKEVYHFHTHHKKTKDLLLKPVGIEQTANRINAIGKIIDHYDEKIIKYHRTIKINVDSKKSLGDAITLIVKAKGEMTYGRAFGKLFEREIENGAKSYLFAFSNALKSIDILANGIELTHHAELAEETSKLTHLIIGLTLAIVILTLPIAIDATFGSLEQFDSMEISEIAKFFISLFYLSALLFIIYRLRNRIKEEFEKSYKILIGIIIVVAIATSVILLYIH